LVEDKRLDVRYQGHNDEAKVFAGNFFLARGPQSRVYFDELRRLIDMPALRGIEKPNQRAQRRHPNAYR
jgi:hypothetical protein